MKQRYDKQIMGLLDSPNEKDHLIALQLSYIANWTDLEVIEYVLNSGKGWDSYSIRNGNYRKYFAGYEITTFNYAIGCKDGGIELTISRSQSYSLSHNHFMLEIPEWSIDGFSLKRVCNLFMKTLRRNLSC